MPSWTNFTDMDDDDDLDVKGQGAHETPPDSLSILVSEIQSLPPESLVVLSDFVNSLLPPVDVQQIDVNQLIANQLRSAKALQSMAMASQFTPTNQKAQALNAATNVIEKLVKLQVEAYNIETFKALERALVTTLRPQPNGPELLQEIRTNYDRSVAALT